MASLLQTLDEIDHILYVISCFTYDIRTDYMQSFLITEKGLGIEFSYVPDTLASLSCRLLHLVFSVIAISSKMSDIGYIHHMLYLISGIFKSSLQDILKNICSQISDVSIVINCRTTTIHRDMTWHDRYKIFNTSRHCVI